MINLKGKKARRAEWAAQYRLQKTVESVARRELRTEFRRVGRAAKAAYLDGGHHAATVALIGHRDELKAILFRLYLAAGTAFWKRAVDQLRKAFSAPVELKLTEDQSRQAMTDFARRTAAAKVTQVSLTTERRIASAIMVGVRDGKSTDEISDDIYEQTGGRIGEVRADLIARTEAHSAANAGSIEAAKSTGVVNGKEWIALDDDRTREDHADVSGTEVKIDDLFSVGDDQLQFPGDPDGSAAEICNCRCSLGFTTDYADASEHDADTLQDDPHQEEFV